MALRFSTKLRNMLQSGATIKDTTVQISAATIAAVDGGTGADSFTDSGNGFVTAGFSIGDCFLVEGFTTGGAGNNGKIFQAVTVAAGTIEIATGLIAGKTAGDTVVLTLIRGPSFRDIFKDGVLRIYSGSQPVSADAAYTGTLLLEISVASGAWAAGAPANGLEFGPVSAGVIAKDGAVWSDAGIAGGTAGWYRFYANQSDDGSLDSGFTHPRFDGAVGTSGAELNMSSTTVTLGGTVTIDTFQITLPMA
jgi:hypothetical protein